MWPFGALVAVFRDAMTAVDSRALRDTFHNHIEFAVRATFRVATAGVAKGNGEVFPTLGAEAELKRKGRAKRRSAQAQRGRLRETPCAARSGQSPLARLVFLIACGCTPD